MALCLPKHRRLMPCRAEACQSSTRGALKLAAVTVEHHFMRTHELAAVLQDMMLRPRHCTLLSPNKQQVRT